MQRRPAPGPWQSPTMRDPYDETEPLQPHATDRQDEVIGLSGLTALAGLWLLSAPILIGYGDEDPALVDALTGIAIMTLALVRVGGAFRSAWPSWVNALLGAWVLTGVWRAESETAATNDLVVGLLVLLFSVASALSTRRALRTAQRRARDDARASSAG